MKNQSTSSSNKNESKAELAAELTELKTSVKSLEAKAKEAETTYHYLKARELVLQGRLAIAQQLNEQAKNLLTNLPNLTKDEPTIAPK